MPTPGTIQVELRLNLEGDWPRSRYLQLCAEMGIEYAEADYLRWRTIGERLSGRPCFETQVVRVTAAFEQLAKSMAAAGKQLQKAFS